MIVLTTSIGLFTNTLAIPAATPATKSSRTTLFT